MITNGEIAMQHVIYETELAKQFNISRTPVREALFQLVKDGLLVSHDRGYTLPDLSLESVKNVYEVRRYIEIAVLDLSAHLLTKSDIARLSALVGKEKRYFEKKKTQAFIQANREFRDLLMSFCPNPYMLALVNLYNDKIQTYRQKALSEEFVQEKVMIHHEKFVEALTKGDLEDAKQIYDQLIQGGINDWEDHRIV
jgi:DNA-binding GntR family transcriptional regulator